MQRITMTLAEWQAVARELAGDHTATVPPGLQERVRALVEHAPQGWPDQQFALELDASCAELVRATRDRMTHRDPDAGQRAASIAEAVRIIHDHQRRNDGRN
jgi:hypothetical protein